ncbi:MAG: NADPH:quinone reductase [Pyrinomonadaceae bacterium]
MRAVVVQQFGGPEVLKVEEVAKPDVGPNQVLVRVAAAGVNPVDVYKSTGHYARLPEVPYTPGSDGAGEIIAIGDGVKHVNVGDRVYLAGSITGTYAEYALCEAAQVHSLPDTITFPQGAAIFVPYATAYRALFQRAHAAPGEFVLVHGASGGVGIAAVQIARAAGLTVIGTAGTERGLQLVREQGAHYVLNHHEPDYLGQLQKLTYGLGVDVILEMLANVNLNKDLGVLAVGGRVVVIGSRGTVEIDPRLTMGRDASIHGMSLPNAQAHEMASIHAALIAGLENGTLRPVVGQEFPLDQAPAALEAVMEPGANGKIVLLP